MPYLSALAPREAQLGASVLLKFSGRLVLAIDGKNRWKTEADGRKVITVSGVGGAAEIDEDFPAAAERECIEETGVRPELESAARTLFVDYDNSVRPVNIDDKLKPAIVYRRVFLRGDESWQLFCPVYLARIHSPPAPRDVPALLSVTLDQLRLLRSPLRVNSLLSKGAHLAEKERIPREAFLVPAGMAEALLAIDSSRFSLVGLTRNEK